MANERLYQFPSKASPVPADIVYLGDSAAAFNEVNATISSIIGAYPNLLSIGGLTLGANTFPYVNGSTTFAAGSITALAVNQLGTAGFSSTVTAAGTTTLTAASNYNQFFTGTTTQNLVLPVVSTLVLGQSYYVVNNSTGVVTVKSSGGNTIQAMAAGTSLFLTVVSISGTTAASWNAEYAFNGGQGSGTVNLGTANQLAYYATSSTIVSGTNLIPNAVAIQGVVDGSSASAGNVGEYISSPVLFANRTSISTATATDLTSITLTGDWDVGGMIYFVPSANLNTANAWTSTSSATLPDNSLLAGVSSGAIGGLGQTGVIVLQQRYNFSTPTTVYLSGYVGINSGTCSQCGYMWARRRR